MLRRRTFVWRVAWGLLVAVRLMASAGDTAQAEIAAVQQAWRFTTERPPASWNREGFDDSAWKTGKGGFGTEQTPNSRVFTPWETNDIWLRKAIQVDAIPDHPGLLIYHDEDAEVYLNGKPIGSFSGYLSDYQIVPLSAEARQEIRQGQNLLAVHCHQSTGGQFIDVHLIDTAAVPKLPLPPGETVPYQTELITQWGASLASENPWPEYPRPQLVRPAWQNLNGTWDYAITPAEGHETARLPESWAGQIRVPFCLESKLSGVGRLLQPDEVLWYRRAVELEPAPHQRRLLHFEAVDYRCRVWVNGHDVGEHTGGNLPFSLDITEAVRAGRNEVVVRVEDETEGAQLHGKQHLRPQGIWYTRVSGIWQTVWLEDVPPRSIQRLDVTTDALAGAISLRADLVGAASAGEQLRVTAWDGDNQVAQAQAAAGEVVRLVVPQARLWSPDQPQLYSLRVALQSAGGDLLDEVASYAGIRSVGKTRDAQGHWRFTLNGKILFHLGPLDQGWWPDGLLTPPSDAAMWSDIEYLKSAGFNMIRKHIKVEPRRYYYHCDRLGIMVWQDQVSGGRDAKWTRFDPHPEDAVWADADHAQYLREFDQMISSLHNHPSIVVWTPFNEAWGQHRTIEVGKWAAARDPSRLINIASGGNFWPVGDIADHHQYPHPGFPFDSDRFRDFILVVGEFGGHGWPVEGHLWKSGRQNWGYGGLPKSQAEYQARYRESIRRLIELKRQGVAAGVYTQTSDVEGELNGLLTYDRRVAKIPAEQLREIHRPLTVD